MIVTDIEQNDPVRIKEERDILAKAICEMLVELKMINPDVPIPAPMLLLCLEDIPKHFQSNKIKNSGAFGGSTPEQDR